MRIGRSIGQLAAMHDRLLAICAESVDWIGSDPEELLQKDYGDTPNSFSTASKALA
jgi:hypothetical protein